MTQDRIVHGIALYDCTPNQCDLKGFFEYMERLSDDIDVPWGSIDNSNSRKMLQFKNGKRKLEKTGFDNLKCLNIIGGVSELGTSLDWKTFAYLKPSNKILFFLFCR